MTGVAAPIVVGVDGSGSALDAVRWAARECSRHRLTLRLVHGYVLPSRGYPEFILPGHEVRKAVEERAQRWLEEASEVALATVPHVPVETSVALEGPVPLLIEESREARLVVVGSQGLGGFTGLLVGSTAIALASRGRSPVVVVRGLVESGGPVVVGVDGSPSSEAAIGFAYEAASTRGAPLVAVMAWTDFLLDGAYDWAVVEESEVRLLAQRLAGWQEKFPDVHVERVVVRDRPVRALLHLAETAQLLVVGSRGRGGFAGMLLGSTSQALVYHSPCPLAVVRPT